MAWWMIGLCVVFLAFFVIVGLHDTIVESKKKIKIKDVKEEQMDDLRIYYCDFTQSGKDENTSYIVTPVDGVYSYPEVIKLTEDEREAFVVARKVWNTGQVTREEIADIRKKIAPGNYRKSA